MKDGTGEGFTRADHPDLSNQLFASYSEVASARSLATVIGEDELSETDKLSLKFGAELERRFITQGMYEDRSIQPRWTWAGSCCPSCRATRSPGSPTRRLTSTTSSCRTSSERRGHS